MIEKQKQEIDAVVVGPAEGFSSFAHEIRDPLTLIMASAELLGRGSWPEDRRRWLLDAILEGCERIAATLNEAQEIERFSEAEKDAGNMVHARTADPKDDELKKP